jgi:nucleotide-binding universal stress UspA family protein
MMNKPVVVAIDGSVAAEAAINWGAAEAASLGTSLRLVHAFAWPLAAVPRGRSQIDPDLVTVADYVIRQSLELAQRCGPGLAIEAVRVPGFLSPVLIEESRHADLLVIGSRGLSGALGTMVCSTALDLAANAHCPVVVIHPDRPRRVGARVVVGYDGSPAGASALHLGADYAQRHNAVLRVVAAHPFESTKGEISRVALAAAVDDLTNGQDAELVLPDGPAAGELLRRSADAQLVVIGARGCGGFDGLLLGSVSQTVLHQADCPVAVIPPAALSRRTPVGGRPPQDTWHDAAGSG